MNARTPVLRRTPASPIHVPNLWECSVLRGLPWLSVESTNDAATASAQATKNTPATAQNPLHADESRQKLACQVLAGLHARVTV